jgi:hypothetical protein
MAHGEGAAVAIANAIKASGVIVRLEPQEFVNLLRKIERPLIVYKPGGGFLSPNHQYLTSYKGLAFFTKSRLEIDFPRGAEVIVAKKLWMPS